MTVVLFIKAYSLKRATVQGGAQAKSGGETTAGDTTASAEAVANGHEDSLQAVPGEQGHEAINVNLQKELTDASEKV